MFSGISAYTQEHTDWSFTFVPNELSLKDILRTLPSPDALLTHNSSFPDKGLLQVSVEAEGSCSVQTDQVEVGRLACEHLLERGLRNLLVLNTGDLNKTKRHQRVQGILDRAREAAVPVQVFDHGPRTRTRGTWRLEDQFADVEELLRELPRPCGLIGCDADHSLRALMICGQAGLRVPEDVAVVSCADDDAVFTQTRPSLSAVVHNQIEVGYEAAARLHALLEGKDGPLRTTIPPAYVASRGSTDWTVTGDPFCEQVLRYIRDHVGENLKVAELAGIFHVSERTLVRRFQSHLGRSPVKEIARARIEAAKILLFSTQKPLSEIALDCGFSGQPHFQREIKQATGMTPGELRRR